MLSGSSPPAIGNGPWVHSGQESLPSRGSVTAGQARPGAERVLPLGGSAGFSPGLTPESPTTFCPHPFCALKDTHRVASISSGTSGSLFGWIGWEYPGCEVEMHVWAPSKFQGSWAPLAPVLEARWGSPLFPPGSGVVWCLPPASLSALPPGFPPPTPLSLCKNPSDQKGVVLNLSLPVGTPVPCTHHLRGSHPLLNLKRPFLLSTAELRKILLDFGTSLGGPVVTQANARGCRLIPGWGTKIMLGMYAKKY